MSCTCAICNEKVSSREPKLCNCSYHFHIKCLREWYYHSQRNLDDIECPCCRQKIKIWKTTRNMGNSEKFRKLWLKKVDNCVQNSDNKEEYERHIIELFDFMWKHRISMRKEQQLYNTIKTKIHEMKDIPQFRKTYRKIKNF